MKMLPVTLSLSLTMAALLMLSLAGCGAPSDSTSTPPSPSGDAHAGHQQGGDAGGDLTDMDKMRAELAKLSPEDARSAEKQHVCPVTGGMLGTMGPPLKVDVEGREVWICCEGCRERLLASPDAYLAKLSEH